MRRTMKTLRLSTLLLGGTLLVSACQATGSGPTVERGDAFATVTLQFET